MTATFPPVGDLERDTALAGIERRHREYDDPRWSEAGTDPREVLDYLRRHRSRLPRVVVDDDVWDELVLCAWVHWDDRRREAEILSHAIARGRSLREVGAFVGVATAQGMRDYLDSLEARLQEYRAITRAPRPPEEGSADPDPAVDAVAPRSPETAPRSTDDEVGSPRRARNPYLRFRGQTRAVRGSDGRFMRDRRRANRLRPTRKTWLTDHHDRIVAVFGEIIEQAGRLGLAAPAVEHAPRGDEVLHGGGGGGGGVGADDLGDYIAWLREDLERATIDDGTFGSAGLAVRALRTHPEVQARARNHGIHQAIAEVDRLRADLAALAPG